MIKKLTARVAELERRLGGNSQNSSRPPSTDPPRLKGLAKKPRSGRRPGGQPGHKGHQRELLPPEKVDHIEDHWPSRCSHCDAILLERRRDASVPLRHQVTEVPPVTPTTVEHRQHSQECPCCGKVTVAPLPGDVPRSAFGPRLMALVTILSGCYRLSKRAAVGAMKDLFGVEMSLGSITASEQAVSAALAAPVTEAHEFIQQQAVMHADETSWVEGRKRAWMWVAATSLVTVFLVCRERSKAAAKSLLGSFHGILVTDRWDSYNWYKGLRQICWAHLKRDFKAMSERRGVAGRIGRQLLACEKQIFAWWHRVREGTMTRAQFRWRMRPVRVEVERLLKEGARSRTSISGSCLEMLRLYHAFFTFVDVEGVEPTNNHGERQIRPAVLWRKTSFGTHSAAGSRFVERIMTVRTSLRQQGRNVVEYIVHAHEAALRGEPSLSLLPGAALIPVRTAA